MAYFLMKGTFTLKIKKTEKKYSFWSKLPNYKTTEEIAKGNTQPFLIKAKTEKIAEEEGFTAVEKQLRYDIKNSYTTPDGKITAKIDKIHILNLTIDADKLQKEKQKEEIKND